MSTRLATALIYRLGLTKEVLLREIGEGGGGAAGHGRGETQARSQPQPILQRERALGWECPQSVPARAGTGAGLRPPPPSRPRVGTASPLLVGAGKMQWPEQDPLSFSSESLKHEKLF